MAPRVEPLPFFRTSPTGCGSVTGKLGWCLLLAHRRMWLRVRAVSSILSPASSSFATYFPTTSCLRPHTAIGSSGYQRSTTEQRVFCSFRIGSLSSGHGGAEQRASCPARCTSLLYHPSQHIHVSHVYRVDVCTARLHRSPFAGAQLSHVGRLCRSIGRLHTLQFNGLRSLLRVSIPAAQRTTVLPEAGRKNPVFGSDPQSRLACRTVFSDPSTTALL
mmetsp:Transcript_4534/g.13853  ORF Transcript_4534/g.13853 Transcript_4534/m.13853 type:complete len:218 (-) Transcript_4534:632-1285(-)